MDEVLQYDFEIKHIPGLVNHLPDRLSRFYDEDPRDPGDTDGNKYVLAAVEEDLQIEKEINSKLISGVYTQSLDDLEELKDESLKKDIMLRAHSEGHIGAADMARKIRSAKRVTWPQMVKDCQEYVSACLPCQRYNIGKHGYHPPKNLMALLPFDHLCIDLKEMDMSAKGNCYYILVIDVATRFVFLRPLPDKSKYTIAQALLRLFCDIGFPKVLQSDNGLEFVNGILEALKQISKIETRTIAPYHHRGQGLVEKAIGVTSQSIYKAIKGLVAQWDDYAPSIQYFYNTRVIDIHGSSPYSLMFARQANGFEDYRDLPLVPELDKDREQRLIFLNSIVFPAILEKVKGKHLKRNEYFMKTHRMFKSDFLTGSQVMIRDELRSGKSEARYEGPFSVIRRKASGNYLLKAVDGTEYVRPPNVLKLVSPEILKDLVVPDTIYVAVDRILDHRDIAGVIQYKVRWKGQPPDHDSWLTQEDFVDYGPIRSYEKKLRISKRDTKVEKRAQRDIQSCQEYTGN
jgi:transposase InsO family protein